MLYDKRWDAKVETDRQKALRLWAAELRSGKHKQCFGKAYDFDGGICAVVVLSVSVPHDFIKAIGDETRLKVVHWNDHDHMTFDQIAALLEAEADCHDPRP